MYLTLLLCSYFYERDFLYSTKFQVAYFELSYSWVRKIPSRRERLPTPVLLGFPYGSAGKESTCNAGDLGGSPGEGKGYPLQYSGLNSMDCRVHGVAKSQTQLSDFHFHFKISKFSSVMSDSLWLHGLQHTRLPCPSPTPGACSNSCP